MWQIFGTKFAHQMIGILIFVPIRTPRGRNTCQAYWNILAASELQGEVDFADLFLRKDLAHVREVCSSLLLMVE